MEVTGWGRFPAAKAKVFEPIDHKSLRNYLTDKNRRPSLLARGAGRSYGDSALAEQLISSRFLDKFTALDEETGLLTCDAGVTLESLLQVCVPRGWFPVVVPGTGQVSIGGAIAADVHGKNHHRDGTFCQHVAGIKLLSAAGEELLCSPGDNAELFHATCGGMGLTGVIVEATLKLRKISSAYIKQQILSAAGLEECLQLLDANNDSHYSVAWLDCSARGDKLGRSVIYLGEHEAAEDPGKLVYKSRRGISVPFQPPGLLVNRYSVGLFNRSYYAWTNRPGESRIHYDKYFFPLDRIAHWNRLYGAKGFLQYQFVLPEASALEGTRKVLEQVAAAGKGSPISVLKKMGPANNNLLSFPMAGYTLALDFKYEDSLFELLDMLDEIVVDNGGRIYLAKDARMHADTFKKTYPNWKRFTEIKNQIDPKQVFASQQSDRIGLTGK